MSQVAVTGASGHVGACLVRQLLNAGHDVRVLVRSTTDTRALAGLDVEKVQGDVCQPSTLTPLMKGVDVLYHLAALISIVGGMDGRVRAVNVHGARNVGRAALDAGVRRMVHTSSVHAFAMNHGGGAEQHIDEEFARSNESNAPAYDASKAAGEVEIRKLIDEGLDAVIVHPAGVIGPFDFGPSRMGQVLCGIGNGSLPGLIGGGFHWVDVRDVGKAMQAAAEHGRTGESYILSGHYAPVKELAKLAAAVTGKSSPRLVVPLGVANVFAPLAETFAKVTRAEPLYTAESLMALRANARFSYAKAKAELDHDPRPLSDTVRDIYAWFAADEQLKSPRAMLQPDAYGPVPTT